MEVEAFGGFVLGVDEYGGDADGLGCQGDAAERVGEKVGAEALAGVSAVDGEAADHRDRDGVRCIASEFAGRLHALDRAGGNAVVGDHPASL